mgnify:CR=1 FL=1
MRASFLLLATLLPTAALAEEQHQVSVMIAPTIGVSDFAKTQFDITQSYTYRVTQGFYAGIEAQEGMGNYFRFSLGARTGYAFELPNLPLTIGPDARIGFSTIDGDGAFNLRLGIEAQYAFNQHFKLVARPIGVNLSMGTLESHSFDILFGVGYAF